MSDQVVLENLPYPWRSNVHKAHEVVPRWVPTLRESDVVGGSRSPMARSRYSRIVRAQVRSTDVEVG